MKKFLKHGNRGLLLSGIVLVALIIFIIADYIQFNTQKDEIKAAINNYYSEIFALDTESKTIDEAKAKYKTLLQDSFTEKGDETFSGSQNTLLSSLENYDISTCNFDIRDAGYQIDEISIKKGATGHAILSVTYRGSITATMDTVVITPGGLQTLQEYYDMYYYYDGPEEQEQNNRPEGKDIRTFTFESQAEISMEKEKGQWKLSSWDNYCYNVNFIE